MRWPGCDTHGLKSSKNLIASNDFRNASIALLTGTVPAVSISHSLFIPARKSSQFQFQQDRLRLRHHVRGRVLATGKMVPFAYENNLSVINFIYGAITPVIA
jgi:hypothetical protein